jgi:SAM-dependent methyltransferase
MNSKFINGKILDVGCGSKPYENLFDCKEYLGLEIIGNKNKSKADFFYEGITFPFEDNTFDSVFCSQVFEHVFEPELFLKEINRVLKPNANIFMTIPFVWDEHEQPIDYARYSYFGIKSLFVKNGFEVILHSKAGNNFSSIFQITSAYIYKTLIFKKKKLKKIIGYCFVILCNFLGLLSLSLPKNDDFYLDNIIIGKKKID